MKVTSEVGRLVIEFDGHNCEVRFWDGSVWQYVAQGENELRDLARACLMVADSKDQR